MPWQQTSSANNIQYASKAMRKELMDALRDTGQYVRGKMAQSPPAASTAYRRSGTLKKSMAVSRIKFSPSSMWLDVGTNVFYAKWVNEGTGLYGPQKQPIKPIGKYLAWRSSGKAYTGVASMIIASGFARRKGTTIRNRKRDVYMNFARSVKGQRPWRFMDKAFDEDSRTYFASRLAVAVANIQAMGGKTGPVNYGYNGPIAKGLFEQR